MRTIRPETPKINNPCPICGAELINEPQSYGTNSKYYNCPYCKNFCLTMPFEQIDIEELSTKELIILKNVFFTLPPKSDYRRKSIDNSNIKEFLTIVNAPNTLIDKIDKLLGYYADKSEYFGENIEIDPEKAARLHFCKDISEFLDILNYLRDKKYINYFNKDPNIEDKTIVLTVTAEGLNYFEKTILHAIKQNQCFVAMWFNTEENAHEGKIDMAKVYSDAIKPAIENDERANKIKAIKINDLNYNSDVVDEIISQIRRSKFVTVDLTGYRGGVYYEAGFAEGLGLQVIYTCNSEWLNGNKDKKIPRVHFDINHKNIIEWEYDKLNEFRIKLQNRINSTIV